MEVTKKEWNNYIKKISSMDKTAADLIAAYVEEFGTENRDALIKYAVSIVQTFANGSAAMAADWHEAISELQRITIPAAEMAALPEYGDVAKTINGVLKETSDPKAIGSAASNLVKRTGMRTTLQNAVRDGAEFAWIPNGDTCPFCLQLASYGWRKAGKNTLKGNHAEHVHANCDCEYAIRYGNDLRYSSYDPEKYEDIFQGAEGDTDAEKRNSIRRMQYKDPERHEKILEQKREAYAEREETVEAIKR